MWLHTARQELSCLFVIDKMSLRFGSFDLYHIIHVLYFYYSIMALFKLQNFSKKTYNGIKPGRSIETDKPTLYLLNGFKTVDVIESEKSDDENKSYEEMTAKELKAILKERWIEYNSRASKADLLKLVEESEKSDDSAEEWEAEETAENESDETESDPENNESEGDESEKSDDENNDEDLLQNLD